MPKAGPDKQLCGAQRLDQPKGVLCRQRAGWGTDHPGVGRCKRHGGSTESHEKAAQSEMARAAVYALGRPREIDPHAALLEEVHRSAGHVAALELLISDLKHEQLVDGVTSTVTGPDGETVTVRTAYSIWLSLYHAERRNLVFACRTAVQCGCEQARVDLAKGQGALIASIFKAVFGDPELGLTPAQRRAAMVAAAGRLRVIDGGREAS